MQQQSAHSDLEKLDRDIGRARRVLATTIVAITVYILWFWVIYSPLHVPQFLTWIAELIQNNWQTAISTLFGTFFGAYVAFVCQRRDAEKKQREANLAAAIAAQFVIMTQLNIARNIKKNNLDPNNVDSRHLRLRPFSVPTNYPRLNIPSLTFMLSDNEDTLITDVMIAEQNFDAFLSVINERNVRHEAMQRRISEYDKEADEATICILKA